MIQLGCWPGKGHVLCGNAEDACAWFCKKHLAPTLVVADPPYGKILKVAWDTAYVPQWLSIMTDLGHLYPDTVVYWWGGIGKPGHRPFFRFLLDVEERMNWRMRDLITWSKKRAYGKSGDYLFTREECAIFTWKGQAYPCFNIPLLDVKRGYAGYSKRYPAKSEFKRRTNVWHETEILRGKLHDAHKAPVVCRIPIEVHTKAGDLVVDLYAGSGETSIQALGLGRPFVAVERDGKTAKAICTRIEAVLGKGLRKSA